MGNSKDERIKRLKRKRIWPSILGLFFISLVFTLILVIQLEANMLDVIQRKVLVPISQTEAVAELFENYEGEHKQAIQDSVLVYIKMIPETESVWVSDLEGNEVWSNNEMTPNLNATHKP